MARFKPAPLDPVEIQSPSGQQRSAEDVDILRMEGAVAAFENFLEWADAHLVEVTRDDVSAYLENTRKHLAKAKGTSTVVAVERLEPFQILNTVEKPATLVVAEVQTSPTLSLTVLHDGKRKLWNPGYQVTRLLLRSLEAHKTLESLVGRSYEIRLRRNPFDIELKYIAPKG